MKKILFLSVFALCAMLATLESCKKADLNASSPDDVSNKTEVPEYVENLDDLDEIGYLPGDKDYPDSDENGNPLYQSEAIVMKIQQVYNSRFDSLPRFKYGSTTAKQKFATRQIVQTIDGGTNFTLKGYGFKTYDSTKCRVQCFIKGIEIPNAKVLAWSDDTIKVNFPKLELAEAITKTFSIKFKVWRANDKVGKADVARSKSRSCISKGQAVTVLLNTNKKATKGAVANIKVFLGGCYDATSGVMYDSLRRQNIIPTTEPYSNLAGFTHVNGGGGETITSGDLAVTTNPIIDWVFIELRSASMPQIPIYTKSAVIRADGSIALSMATIPSDYYYVAVRHRNHLGAMTKEPVYLSATATDLDFTAGIITQATADQRLISGKYALYPGNIIQDGKVNYGDPKGTIITDAAKIWIKIGGQNDFDTVKGYFVEDATLDGEVKFTDMGNDRLKVLQSSGGVNAVKIEALR